MTMLLLALAFTILLGFGVVGLLLGGEVLKGTIEKKLTFAVAWGAVTFVTYGVFLVIIWPAG